MMGLRLATIAIVFTFTALPCNAEMVDFVLRTSRTLTEGMPVRFGRELSPSEVADGATVTDARGANRLPALQRIFDWDTASYSAPSVLGNHVSVDDPTNQPDKSVATPVGLSLTGLVAAVALQWSPNDAMHRANEDFTRVFEDLVGIVPGNHIQAAPTVAAAGRLQGMVPIPASIWLFATALLVLPVWRSRLRS